MDLNRIIQDLKVERDRLAAAIECLERLAAGRVRKRGRPSACLRPASGLRSDGSAEQGTHGAHLRRRSTASFRA